MDTASFHNPPGELVKNLDGNWSYVPNALPPILDWPYDLFVAIHDAAVALSRLDGLGRRLPNPQRLVRMFLRREAELSSRIENTYASVKDLLLFPDREKVPPSSDVLEVNNNFLTLEFAIASAESRDLTTGLIKEMHAMLLRGVRGHDKTPGRFRTVQAHIGRTERIDDARFVPAPPHAIDGCMADLERYLGHDDKLFPIVRAALVHYQFETIHPFADGNGRVGRVLLLLQLIKEKVLCAPLLNPSAQLERHRRAYYDGLLNVSQQGDWSGWIRFFVSGLAEEAADAAARIESFETLREQYHRQVATPRASALLPQLVDQLLIDPAITNARTMQLFGITSPSAQNLLDRLTDLGILQEVTGRPRHRIYMAQGVIDLFSDDVSS